MTFSLDSGTLVQIDTVNVIIEAHEVIGHGKCTGAVLGQNIGGGWPLPFPPLVFFSPSLPQFPSPLSSPALPLEVGHLKYS